MPAGTPPGSKMLAILQGDTLRLEKGDKMTKCEAGLASEVAPLHLWAVG